VKLVWWQACPSQTAAREREVEVKGWNRKKKLELMRAFEKRRREERGVNPSPRAREAQGKGE